MQQAMTAEQLRAECSLGEDARTWSGRLRVLGLVALLIGAGLGFADGDGMVQFFHSYLVAFVFFLAITLGCFFFVFIQHLVGAKWSVVVRRVAEIFLGGFPLLAVLFLPILIPVLLGKSPLYEWSHSDAVAGDKLLTGKSGFLNVPFFTIRCVIYFAVWIGLGRFFIGHSRAQDLSGDPSHTLRMRKFAPVAAIAYALTSTFAAFDLLMSLEPHWFSTIFGVYFFAGSALSAYCSIALACMLLQEQGKLKSSITTEHYHDLGKLMFAWVFFWGYIAFSQYMLIWYANLPEETFWYLKRQHGNWTSLSLLLLFGHLFIPFAGLLSRHVKRNRAALAFWAIVLLGMHWVDMYWLVMPRLHPDGIHFTLVDLACLIGIGGLFAGGFLNRARGGLLAAIKDPFWDASVQFKNF